MKPTPLHPQGNNEHVYAREAKSVGGLRIMRRTCGLPLVFFQLSNDVIKRIFIKRLWRVF